jgi:signal transduction histidine kinase
MNLTAKAPPEPAERIPNALDKETSSRAISILLVDDNKRNLDALESILASPELRLVRAQTPDEALLWLVHNEFACIVLDVQMPGMNGFELARLIKTRKRSQHIPIIFITAYLLEEKDALQGYVAGAVDYLTKPVNPQILKSKVGVFVDLFRTTRALAGANAALQIEISQRKKAEDALRDANSKLEMRVQDRVRDLKKAHDELVAASRAKDNFLATLSHELRTPLSPILVVAGEAVLNQKLPAKTRADFEMILKNIELEARLIDDLLDLTRIARGQILLEKGTVDVHTALRDACANVQEEILQKKISLTLKLHAPRHSVFADPVRLQQVFWNVIRNAVKFTPQSGRIIIETETAPDSRMAIKVTDTGIGMNAMEMSRLFTAFSQTENIGAGAAHRFGGLGLGLSISQKLLELHSGRIRASSQGRDKGSTFTIELPLMQPMKNGEVRSPASPVMDVPSAPANGLRVLVVEDHEPTRTALANMLTRRSYQVTTAASLAEARTFAGTENFSLLISDLGLPDGSGYELMAELKKRTSIRGIALTGYGMAEDIARSKEAGFLAHLTKPVRVQSLEAALNAATKSLALSARS